MAIDPLRLTTHILHMTNCVWVLCVHLNYIYIILSPVASDNIEEFYVL